MSSVPYISEDTVSKLLTWEVAFQAVEAAMECVAKDPATQNHRTFTTVPETQTLLLSMPGYLDHAKFGALACKLVTVGPTNSQLQLPTINANIMLFDEVTGVIKAIVAGTGITTWRTAAASAVATKHLKPDSSFRVLAVLGAGVQGRIHAIAFQHFFSFEEIRIWNRSKRRAQQLVDELNGSLGARVLHFESNEECVRGADVVVTATSSRGPLVELEWLKPGAHINAVGAGADHVNELAGSIYSTGEIYVDHRSGAERELKTLSELGVEFKGEVGGVICGDLPRPASDRITVFQSLGMAVEDGAVARAVYDLSRA